MTTADTTLELSPDEMQRLITNALEHVVAHITSLPQQPAVGVEGATEIARRFVEPLPEQGQAYPELLRILFHDVFPKSFNTAGPGYLAYIPGGGVFHAAVADFITSAINRYMGIWAAAPALAQLEATVLRWLYDLVGYPATARGVLTTGGSLANFSAVVTARREQLPEQFLSGTLYVSDQTHHSIQKAALLAGFPPANVRAIPVDERFCVRPNLLQQHIREDRRAGFTPFLIVGNAGTTNTGAVDDLAMLADIAEQERLWLHIDAAYGGFFLLTEHGRTLMRGIDRADSVTLDPHKGLFLPYGTGSLLVRDGAALKRAHGVTAAYLPTVDDDPDIIDFAHMSPELSRESRGLRVWLPVKMHGINPFRRNLQEKLDLTRWATEELRTIPYMQIVAEPQLSVVAFRLAPAGLTADALDHLNRALLQQINTRKRVHLSSTLLNGQFVIRICVLSFRTHFDRMQMCLEDIRQAVREVIAGA